MAFRPTTAHHFVGRNGIPSYNRSPLRRTEWHCVLRFGDGRVLSVLHRLWRRPTSSAERGASSLDTLWTLRTAYRCGGLRTMVRAFNDKRGTRKEGSRRDR